MKRLISHLVSGFHRFCEKTSFHGFVKIWQTKVFFWKVFWAIVSIGALCMTTFQVYRSVYQYVTQSPKTVIFPANEDEILYPHFGLCYWHWLYWVDWKKARSKYSKEALLFGLTYFNTIFSTVEFDVDKAHDSFVKQMKLRSHSSVLDFFHSIAREVPIWDKNKFRSFFDKTNIVFQDPNVWFCYEVSSENMFRYFAQNQAARNLNAVKTISFMTIDETFDDIDINRGVNLEEFEMNMQRWIEQKANYTVPKIASKEPFKQFVVPIVLFLNGYTQSGIQISAENFAYYIRMKATAFTWQNRPGYYSCDESFKTVSTNNRCELICEAQSWQKLCSCQYLAHAMHINADQPDTVCRKLISYLANGTEIPINATDRGNYWTKRTCSPDTDRIYEKCVNSCAIPCQIWKYETSLTVTTMPTIVRNVGIKHQTNVFIEYPSGKDIVIMIEADNQSWENFIGSVGGLLGIWTGASILSFVEFIFLCCFDDNECFATFREKRQKNITHVKTLPKNVIQVEKSRDNSDNTVLSETLSQNES